MPDITIHTKPVPSQDGWGMHDFVKWATLDNGFVRVERINDCEVTVAVKEPFGLGRLRSVADFLNLAAEFYEIQGRLPVPASATVAVPDWAK